MNNTQDSEQPAIPPLPPATGSADDRIVLTPEQLDAMMPPGERVHTFMQGGPAIIGCDRDRSEILKAARERGAELSGKAATSMKHGAVIWAEDRTPVFVATLPNDRDQRRRAADSQPETAA
jgi:hypothetical protein